MDRTENIDFCIRYLAEQNGVETDLRQARLLQDKQRLLRALMNIWQPQPLSPEFIAAQDAELGLQREEKGVVPISGSGLSVWQGDITRLQADAIVNAANAQMLGCFQPLHACIDNAIHSAAGLQLRQECNDLMRGRLLPTGKAVITGAYNLPARHVLHTVGPIVGGGEPSAEQEKQLADCYRNCLDTAAENGCRNIAFCCISTGVFGYPQASAAELAVRTVKEWMRESQKSKVESPKLSVIFCTFKDYDTQLYRNLLQ